MIKNLSVNPIFFPGNKSVKALVQLMSASMAGVLHLDYHSFGDFEFDQKFNSCLQLLYERQVSISITPFPITETLDRFTSIIKIIFIGKAV